MSDKKDENTFLSNMRESPLSTIIKAFRHGRFITTVRLILYLIISCRFFGICTQALGKLKFRGECIIFNGREKFRDKHLIARPIISILRSGGLPVLLSFLFVIGIYWFSLSVTFPVTSRNIIESLMPKQINGFFTLDTTIYVTLLTTIAGITGVFLALYFTTLS